MPITARRGRETNEEAHFIIVLIDEQQSFVLNPIAVEISFHDQEVVRVLFPELLACEVGRWLRPTSG